MEKALEILKSIKTQIITLTKTPNLDEAIVELEEAMKPKTCDGCVRINRVLIELSSTNGGVCGNCKRFVQDRYEPKDNA